MKFRFLSLLKSAKTKYDFELLAYCLMDNHIHLLVVMHEDPVPNFMRWINQQLACYLNFKMSRTGHILEGRYHSVELETPAAVTSVIRYIHRNPVAAKMTSTVDYPWSSHRAYLNCTPPNWYEAHKGLALFGAGKSEARRVYRQFVELPMDLEHLKDHKVISDRELEVLEKHQIPGLHEAMVALEGEIGKRGVPAEWQLERLFARLCMMVRLNPATIRESVQKRDLSKRQEALFREVINVMLELSGAHGFAAPEEIINFLCVPEGWRMNQEALGAVNSQIGQPGLLDVYRQTFPQSEEAGKGL